MIIGPFGREVVRHRHRFAPLFGLHCLRHQSECVHVGPSGRMSRLRRVEVAHMRGRKNPPLEIVPVPDGAPLRSTRSRRPTWRTTCCSDIGPSRLPERESSISEGSLGGWAAEAITPDSVRNYQMHRRRQAPEAATVNRETSALSRMFQLAIRRGQLERMPRISVLKGEGHSANELAGCQGRNPLSRSSRVNRWPGC